MSALSASSLLAHQGFLGKAMTVEGTRVGTCSPVPTTFWELCLCREWQHGASGDARESGPRERGYTWFVALSGQRAGAAPLGFGLVVPRVS